MRRYRVVLSRTVQQWARVTVEAEDEAAAVDEAIEKAAWEDRRAYPKVHLVEPIEPP